MLDKSKNRGVPKPYLRNLNVRWFGFDLSDVLEMRFEESERERYTAIKGDLLICEGGYPGRGAIWPYDEPVYLQKALHRVRFHEPERAKWFLYFLYLSDIDGSLRQHFTGAGIQHFTGEALKRFRIPVPPLPEQKRIVAILDEAFEGIDAAVANAEKNLANARELFESYLNSVFTRKVEGWVEKPLDQLGRLQTGTTPKTSEQGNVGNHIPFIKPGDFNKDGSLDYENNGLSELGLKSSRLIRGGAALMVCIGATIGKAAFAERDISANQQVNAITPKEGVSGKFLYYEMITRRFQDAVVFNAGQTTLPIINKSKWGDLAIFLPPSFDQQMRIVEALDDLSVETSRLEDVYTQKLSALAELKQTILQKAFAGELTAPPEKALQEAAE
jgi:type I restriction enzyme S subunit